jgi:hypothetical protein
MKKFYTLALALLCVSAAASAQTLKLYHNEGTEEEPNLVEVSDGYEITVTEVSQAGDATHGYIYTFDSGMYVEGDTKGSVTYNATRVGNFSGDGFAYQICPDECTNLEGETATGSFTYRTSFGQFPLSIHYSLQDSKSEEAPIAYAKVKYTIAYDANPASKLTFTVTFDNDPKNAGVDNITVDNSNAPVEYYNLNGVRVANPTAPGLYVRRQGTSATKHLLR